MLGNAALPPFERWSMTAPRFLQYLANLLHVHMALERATAAALAAGQQQHNGVPRRLQWLHGSVALGAWPSRRVSCSDLCSSFWPCALCGCTSAWDAMMSPTKSIV